MVDGAHGGRCSWLTVLMVDGIRLLRYSVKSNRITPSGPNTELLIY
jgi:hypothetical protein